MNTISKNSLKSTISRLSVLLLFAVLSGCGGSSSNAPTDNAHEQSSVVMGEPTASDSPSGSFTRISFDITVPVYVSNGLQVRLQWGEKDILASWVVDESWFVIDDFPIDTINELVVTFSDDNGATTLASFETDYGTGAGTTESYQILANQFDSEEWDSDNDGVSNLSEAIAGTNLQGNDGVDSVQASLKVMPVKTIRISWQSYATAEFYRVLENTDGVSGYNQIGNDLDSSITSFTHSVALYNRDNARYIVQACNTDACQASNELLMPDSLVNAIGYFKASNTEATDFFGTRVSLSADGNTMAVAATGEDSAIGGIRPDQNNNDAIQAGAVYVFSRESSIWRQSDYIKASNTDENDDFGYSLDLASDGNSLVVSSNGEDSAAIGINGDENDSSATSAGAASLFKRVNEVWTQHAYLKAPMSKEFGFFAGSVSISADGDTVAVSASSDDSAATGVNGDQADTSASGAGAVFLY